MRQPRVSSQAVTSVWDVNMGQVSLFVPPSSPEILNQITRQRILQPADGLLSVKRPQTGPTPARSLTVWYLSVSNSFAVSLATRASWSLDTWVVREQPSLNL